MVPVEKSTCFQTKNSQYVIMCSKLQQKPKTKHKIEIY